MHKHAALVTGLECLCWEKTVSEDQNEKKNPC